jgi:hypothetical protein
MLYPAMTDITNGPVAVRIQRAANLRKPLSRTLDIPRNTGKTEGFCPEPRKGTSPLDPYSGVFLLLLGRMSGDDSSHIV